MTTTPAAAIGGDELAKALRDAYGQGCRHAVGVAPESATAYRGPGERMVENVR